MNAHHIFANILERRFDETCPAVQDAIDRIVAHEGFRGRAGMLEALRGAHYGRQEFCSSLLSSWREEDVLQATGHSRNWWLALLDAAEGSALFQDGTLHVSTRPASFRRQRPVRPTQA